MSDFLVGIDAGGTMVKAALFDLGGNQIDVEHRANGMTYPHVGWTERDPDAMWVSAAGAIATLLERNAVDPARVRAVAPSGYGGGVFLIGADGAAVRPGLGSTDSRAITLIDGWKTSGLKARIEQDIQQEVWPGQTLPLLAWFQAHEPEVEGRAAHVLLCKDYLRFRLCGDVSTDLSDAGCAGLLDVARGEYALDAIRAAGLGGWIAKLPPIRPAMEIAGHVSAAAAAQTGLRAGTPVARGLYDVVGCSLASGLRDSRQLGLIAGTFSISSTLHDRPCLDPVTTLQSPYPLEGLYIASMATPTSASNLEWLCKTMLAAETEKALLAGRSIYDVCSELVTQGMTRESGAMFLPYLFGGPKGAPGTLIGVTAGTDLSDVLRAVFEGIVFAHRSDIDYLLGGAQSIRPSSVLLAGGPSKSDVWAQMFCDAIGLPLEIANATEFGAKAAAICGAVATGAYADVAAAVAGMCRVERSFQPCPERTEILRVKYEHYRHVSAQLTNVWALPPAAMPAPVPAGASA